MKLFHYTDGTALLNIVKNQELWLTHINYMNDSSEFNHGIEIIYNCIKEEIDNKKICDFILNSKNSLNNFFGFFIGSFSSKPDVLSQWRGYCPPQGGYAIEFDHRYINIPQKTNIVKCIYSDKKKYDTAKTMILKNKDKLYSLYNQNGGNIKFAMNVLAMMMTAVIYKNSSFSEESEYRLVYSIINPEDATDILNFREKNGIIIPFVKHKFKPDAIKNIWIGPMKDPDIVEKSLTILLKSQKKDGKSIFHNIPQIIKSKIPYRF